MTRIDPYWIRTIQVIRMVFWKEGAYRSEAYKALRDSCADMFGKHLLKSGFKLFRKDGSGALFHHYRRKSNSGYDYVSVQFNKYARPEFVLNVAKIPEAGVTLNYSDEHVDAEQIDCGHMNIAKNANGLSGRMYQKLGRSLVCQSTR